MAFGALLGQSASGGGFTKNEILAPETPPIYNLGADATPNDMFQNIFAVGDIKVSTRTDLGDSWLLCNGDIIDKTEYPGLVELFPKDGGIMTQVASSEYIPPESYEARTQTIVENYVCFLKGGSWSKKYAYKAAQFPESEIALRDFPVGIYFPEMVRFGDKYAVFDVGSTTLILSDSLDGPWERKDIQVDSNVYYSGIESLHYVNGHYIAFLQDRYPNITSTDKRTIAYTDDIESGEWKLFKPGAFKGERNMNAIGFMQGKWVLFGKDWDAGRSVVSVSKNADITSFDETYRVFNAYLQNGCISLNDKIYAPNGRMYVMKSTEENMVEISNNVISAGTKAYTDGRYIFSGNTITDTETDAIYAMKNTTGSSGNPGYGNGFYVWGGSKVSYISIQDAIGTYLPEVSVPNAYAYIRGK